MRANILAVAGLAATAVSAADLRLRQEPGNECESVISEHQDALALLPSQPTDGDTWTSFLGQQSHVATLTDPCVIPAVTGDADLVSTFSSFVAEVTSWMDTYSDEINSFLSACHEDTMYGPIITSIGLPIESDSLCDELFLQTLESSAETSTETETVTSTFSEADETTSTSSDADEATTTAGESDGAEETAEPSESESESPDVAPRQTGAAMAALAAAGLAVVMF